MRTPSIVKAALWAFVAVVVIACISIPTLFWGQTLWPMMPTIVLLAPVWWILFHFNDLNPPAAFSVQIVMTTAIVMLTALGYAGLATLWEWIRFTLPPSMRLVWILLTFLVFVAAIMVPPLLTYTAPQEEVMNVGGPGGI